jgi:prepilin-type N-terminal cleavage/methylation domain-containing protein/prepilin-type processing-associated H-X9-DG protein
VAVEAKRRAKGFTLIELLVVIAIIAILAAILFPVIAKAKEKGRQAACLGNMKQLGNAFVLYVDDWHALPGAGPYHRPDTSGTNPYGDWVISRGNGGWYKNTMDIVHGGLFPYTRSATLYMCPSDDHARKVLDGKNIFGLSYSMNNLLDRDQNANQPVTMASIRRPSKTVLLIDEGHGTTGGGKQASGMVDAYFGPGFDDPGYVHTGGSNFAYCDGHAAWAARSRYQAPFNPTFPNPNKLNFNPASNW